MTRVFILPTILLALLGGVCLLLTSGRTPRADQITFASQADIHTLDPQQMSWTQDLRVAMALWEGLLTYHPVTLAPAPGCAQLPQISADGLTYTFQLRPHLQWSNGEPLTAQDFADSWQRALDPATSNKYVALFFKIAGAQAYNQACVRSGTGPRPDFSAVGIRVLDPVTLQVTLVDPCPYFCDLVAFPPFYPLHLRARQKAVAAGHPWTHPPYLVTNGPFVLKEWDFKNYLRLDPNPYYHDRAQVHCAQLRLVTYPDQENAALLAYQSGVVDILSWVPQQYIGPELIAQQRAGQRHDIFFQPVFGTYFYVFNCRQAPFNDARVRQAFTLVIDKRQLVEDVLRMGQRPLNVIVAPDAIPGYSSPRGLVRDVPRAQALLAAAGFPEGRGFPAVDLLYANEGIHVTAAQAIGQMWERHLGVRVVYHGVESKQFNRERQAHHFAVARGGWYGDYLDPTTWLDLAQTGSGQNDGQFSDPHYDALLAKAQRQTVPAQRLALLTEAERYLLEDQCAFMPVCQYSDGYVYDPARIAGCAPNVRLITQFKYLRRR